MADDKTTLKNIDEVFPGAKDNPMIVSLVEALDEAAQLRVMAGSEAGRKTSSALWEKSVDLIAQLRGSYKDCPELELRTLCAALDIQMSLYEELVNAGFIEKAAEQELDEAVKGLGE